MNIELLPIAEKKIRQMGGEAMGVVVRRDDGILVAVTDSGRVTRLDDAVAGPVGDGAQGAKPVGYPDCDTCGGSMDYMPWHYATETERHLHACNECWPKVNPANPGATVPEYVVEALSFYAKCSHMSEPVENGEIAVKALTRLLTTPQQSGEWVRCEDRLPIYPPDKLMRNMRDAHDYALDCKDDGIEGPAAIWSVQVYSAVRQWLLAQPSKDKQEGDV